MKSSWMNDKNSTIKNTGKSIIMENASTNFKPRTEYIVYQLCSSHQDVKHEQWGGKKRKNGSQFWPVVWTFFVENAWGKFAPGISSSPEQLLRLTNKHSKKNQDVANHYATNYPVPGWALVQSNCSCSASVADEECSGNILLYRRL